MSVANQRIVKIHKANKQKDPFLSLNLDIMTAAYKDLGNAYTFYLYICLCGNADNHNFEFSPQYMKDRYGLPISTTHDQFKRLIEKGYLIPKNEGSNIYDFYAEPEHLKSANKMRNFPERFDFN